MRAIPISWAAHWKSDHGARDRNFVENRLRNPAFDKQSGQQTKLIEQ
jgi:hypothetical protein